VWSFVVFGLVITCLLLLRAALKHTPHKKVYYAIKRKLEPDNSPNAPVCYSNPFKTKPVWVKKKLSGLRFLCCTWVVAKLPMHLIGCLRYQKR